MSLDWGRVSVPHKKDILIWSILLILAPMLVKLIVNLETNTNISVMYIDKNIFIIIICYLVFQIISSNITNFIANSYYLSDWRNGTKTPAGNIHSYYINGLQSWLIANILYIVLSYFQIIDPGIIAKNWPFIYNVCNLLGFLLAIFAYIKAYIYPSFILDCKYTNSFLYDFIMGIELNPRISNFDFKLFFNGRTGIIAWSLINYSFSYLFYEKYGYITNSIILVNLFQLIYILDFYWYESWYLKTIDINLEHFGWYLAWGDLVWLPFMYTIQIPMLLNQNEPISNFRVFLCLLFFIIGYYIFRTANSQKDLFKNKNGSCQIWGYPVNYISVKYKTIDGHTHDSKLLISGFWGFARHFNYLGDILIAISFSLPCNNLIAYFYPLYMILLLIGRIERDEHKCSKKYDNYWNEYKHIVKWKLIPYIY